MRKGRAWEGRSGVLRRGQGGAGVEFWGGGRFRLAGEAVRGRVHYG